MFNKHNSYGFVNLSDMPQDSFTEGNLSRNLLEHNWATTEKYDDLANNHCAAVLTTNLAIYFKNMGYNDLINNNERDTFIEIHKIIGNGPVPTITNKTKRYFYNRGYILISKTLNTFQQIKDAIGKSHPIVILLMRNLMDWHWVMVIGWREYSSGDKYLRIIDGWNNTTNKFYRINHGSYCISKTEYYLNSTIARND